jgi:hypothetical protein
MKRLGILVVLAAFLLACTAAPPPSVSPSSSPSPSQSAGPSPASAFYLRAWHSQSLPPEHTFSWLPVVTIADGVLLDGNVAVDAMFPGPLMISPIARPITEGGIDAILDLADQLGMLGHRTDFTGDEVAPGSRLGQIEIESGGNQRILVGDPALPVSCQGQVCAVDPGTPEAFAAFWQQLANAGTWLEPELGDASSYEPERVAMLLIAPVATEPGLSQEAIEWPLSVLLELAGSEFPGTDMRCLTLAGADLDVLLPTLQDANQLTVFFDEESERSAVVRVLVPREESVCPATM